MNKQHIELYTKFRQELDKLCIPIILNNEIVKEIKYDDKVVGIICGSPDYIDCIYIEPEYRRKGLAKNAALEWYREYGNKLIYNNRISLHIINNNKPALRFWNKVFELCEIDNNKIDGLYEIVKPKRK